jgi:predicted MPP superfamily phosphohydrolase
MGVTEAQAAETRTRIVFDPPGPINARQMWANNRFWMETQNLVTKRYGGKRRQHWNALLLMLKVFEWGLARSGQLERGRRNAARIVLRDWDLFLPGLPHAFEDFSILHISDPHLDGMPGIEDRIVALVEGRTFDLCVLTGDYRTELHGPIRAVMGSLERIVRGVSSRQGFLGVLGNHDDCHMVAPMEAMGIRMLINETVVFTRGTDRLRVVGTDDVHYYYTDQSLHVLEMARDDFTIALIHSPELFAAAAEAGVALYLCGHTHGGQVCLPGGAAPLKHLRVGRHIYKGRWKHGPMQGITNTGAGTSGIPVRFNTESEILALRLRRADPSAR